GGVDELNHEWSSSSERRAGLVMQTHESLAEDRLVKAKEAAVDYKNMPGLITCTWSAGVVHAFTFDQDVIDVFDSAPEGLFVAKKIKRNRGATVISQYTRTTTKSKRDTVVYNYPSLITWLCDKM
ncbi:unnamed protein product, partial [Pylaiella littoralis]